MMPGGGHERTAAGHRGTRAGRGDPAVRPRRPAGAFAKAAAAGADLVVLDLEDAVAPDRKDDARKHVAEWLAGGHECAVRINVAGTEWYRRDVAAVTAPGRAVMLPKAEDLVVLHELAAALGDTGCVLALIETARGVVDARDIAAVPGMRRLAFGSFDFAAQLGVAPTDREALGPARGALVLVSAAAGLAGPIDGVTCDLHDEDLLTDDARHARQLGFTGKLCAHPKQVRWPRPHCARGTPRWAGRGPSSTRCRRMGSSR
ncbi:HpcH/HpaI aldolase/citrate lyase family protein [Saccharopolyspora hattusasensis]|uniref:HpcH/HpaI aldolase/citrate lyase family protein n=1 Tax=Saccharopolyspora hattusasensis TaxID=1128679 RepID=UPI003D98B1D7